MLGHIVLLTTLFSALVGFPVKPSIAHLPTSEDRIVLATVFADYCGAKKEGPRRGSQVLLINRTPGQSGFLAAHQIRADLQKGCDLPAEVGDDLRTRNSESVSLKTLDLKKFAVLVPPVRNPNPLSDPWSRVFRKHPGTFAWVETFLPGYSRDGKQAVVRFFFGPTAHGATMTYFLTKEKTGWVIKWQSIAYYA